MSYDLLSMLPEGATSRTRLAVRDGRRKVVLREVREGVEPFLPESTPAAVLPLIELWEVQSGQFAVFDYVPGATLRELVETLREQDRPVPLGLVGRIVVDAARAIGEVHATHPPLPSHGGLSDSAMLVGFDGAVRVLDYGVPRPGRFQPSVQSGPHGDVFALGAVLHSVLTDFAGSYGDAVDDGVPLPPPTQMHDEATPALDDVVARATSRAFARRQVDAGSLAEELEAVLGDALFTQAQVAEAVGALFSIRAAAAARAVQLEPDEALLSDTDNAPTGAHAAPWLRTDETAPALEPVKERPRPKGPSVPWVTGMTRDDLPAASAVSPFARIPSGTEPGRPGPLVIERIPSGTEPGRAGPFAYGAGDVRPAALGSDEGELSGTALRARHPVALGSDEGALEGTAPRAQRPAELGSDEGALEGTAPRAQRPAELGSDEGALEGTAPRAQRPPALGSDAGTPRNTSSRAPRPSASGASPRSVELGTEAGAPRNTSSRTARPVEVGSDVGAPRSTSARAKRPVDLDAGDDLSRMTEHARSGDDRVDTSPRSTGLDAGDEAPGAELGREDDRVDTSPGAKRPAELDVSDAELRPDDDRVDTSPRARRPAELDASDEAPGEAERGSATSPRSRRPVELDGDDEAPGESDRAGTSPRAKRPGVPDAGEGADTSPRVMPHAALDTEDEADGADGRASASPRAKRNADPDVALGDGDASARTSSRAKRPGVPDAGEGADTSPRVMPHAALDAEDEADGADGRASASPRAQLPTELDADDDVGRGDGTSPRALLPDAAKTGEDDDLPAGAASTTADDAADEPPAPRPSAADGRAGPRPRPLSGSRASSTRARPSRVAAEVVAPTVQNDLPASAASDTADDDVPPPLIEAEPTRPRASAPLPPARRAASVSEAPALGDGEPEPTRPRARAPAAQGVESVDTNPRASAPRSRNTTMHERLQARGQERIATPPVGVPAVEPDAAQDTGDDELDHGLIDEPTNVRAKPPRRKPAPPPRDDAEGAGVEPPPAADTPKPPIGARPIIAGLLLLLALGFGAIALFAPQKLTALRAKLGLAKAPAPEPGELPAEVPDDAVPDAGEAAQAEADGGGGAAAVVLDEADAGEDEDEVDEGDGGEDEDDADAGVESAAAVDDAGVPDGGALEDGGATKPEAKSPPPRKKKKRKRRRR